MRTLYNRLDRYLLLNHPRVWAARVHTAALILAPIYLLLALFGIAVRVITTPRIAQLVTGQSFNYSSLSGFRSATDQFQDSFALSLAVRSAVQSVASAGTLVFVAATLLGLIASALWFRQVHKHSVERIHGLHKRGHSWIEALCYLVCTVGFAACGVWTYFWMSSTAHQHRSYERMQTESKRAIASLAIEKYQNDKQFVNADGSIDFSDVAFRLSGVSEPYVFTDLVLLRPDVLDFNSAVGSTFGSTLTFQNSPLSDEAAAYLDLLTHAAYKSAINLSDGPLHDVVIDVYARILAPWIVSLLAYALFAGKKTQIRYALAAIGVGAFLLPLLVLIVALIGDQLYGATIPNAYVDSGKRIQVSTSLAYCAVFGVVLWYSLSGRFGVASSRRHMFATLLIPIGIGYGILLLTLGLSYLNNLFPSLSQVSDDERERRQMLLSWFVTLLPFVWVPILPLLDTALRRWRATPVA
jgi:hypothetical protein